ncbi:hypothetical protein P8625_08380 [Tenacibaculum tangerinum]|uniref:Uncharacterized protein n=1 Tax=Tenacibaculum tangerinum TaxID=3038772 RepID=A0ABY8KY14_9FLAO|nr:hypothetical protein [Tenacibaculum tangerinum]WGH74137.1 hypothetical protein P8625_08380 [Tenacibaculum tangerinum]
MSFIKKIQQPLFWKNVAKVAIPFFVLVTIISLFMNSWRDIFAGDFEIVNQTNFADGKWVRFWGIKVVLSFIYGVWVTNKKMK